MMHRFLSFKRSRSGLTAVEMVMALGTLSMAAGIMIPAYRDYVVRNDLELARQRIAQGIERAKFLSQVAMNDSSWGFTILPSDSDPNARGVLFMGDSYETRNPAYDELYPIPNTIQAVGIGDNPEVFDEVVFEKITGLPEATGTINLATINGEQRQINVNLGDDGTVSVPEDWLEICANAYTGSAATITVPDSLWEYYENNGATMGACSDAEISSSVASSSSVSSSSSSSSSSSVGGGGGSSSSVASSASSTSKPVDIDERDDGSGDDPDINDGDDDILEVNEDFTCTVTVLGADYVPNGVPSPVTFDFKFNGYTTGWESPFGNSDNSPVDNSVSGGDTASFDCPEYTGVSAGAPASLHIKARSWLKKKSWYDGTANNHWQSNMSLNLTGGNNWMNDQVVVLTDGDRIPSVSGANSPASVEDYVSDYVRYEGGQAYADLEPGQYIYLFELGQTDTDSSGFDLQDLVVLFQFYAL